MNFKLKALTVAAIAAMSLSGVANAIPTTDMFVVAFDSVTKNSFVASLGFSASTFTNTTQSVNYSADANWATFAANSTAANTAYQVLGWNGSTLSGTGAVYTTSNDITDAGQTSRFNQATAQFGAGGIFLSFLSNNPSATNYVASSAVFGKGSDIGIDWATAFNNFTTTAALGTNDNFYKISKPTGAKSVTPLLLTTYTGDANANSYWNLSTTGVLNYTVPTAVAAIPEADTSAMMLAGLGLMGFVARRRRG